VALGAHQNVRDVAWTLQHDLPEVLRTTFENTLRPELITLLRQQLPPLTPATTPGCTNRAANDILSGESGSIREVISAVEDIRKQVEEPKIIRHQIECCLRGNVPTTRLEHVATTEKSLLCPSQTRHNASVGSGSHSDLQLMVQCRGSMQQV
jgi:hypothetical protein